MSGDDSDDDVPLAQYKGAKQAAARKSIVLSESEDELPDWVMEHKSPYKQPQTKKADSESDDGVDASEVKKGR